MNDKHFNNLFDKFNGKKKNTWKDMIYDPFSRTDDEEEGYNDRDYYIDFIREYMSDVTLNSEPPKKTAEQIKMEKRKENIDKLLS
jgi:hypothetical protein